MNKSILFGAGFLGAVAVKMLGKEEIDYFLDNNKDKDGSEIMGIPVFWYENKKKELVNRNIVLSVDEKKYNKLRKQLLADGITEITTFQELERNIAKRRAEESKINLQTYYRAIDWILKNSIDGEGIINNSNHRKSYPEVTGYFIPSLLAWGYRDLAITYAKWLCSIQKEDGSWYDTDDKEPYIFDSAQILKGLIAVYDIYPDVKEHIIKGCDWIVDNITEEGRLPAVNPNTWQDGKTLSELVHIYCLSPLKKAGEIFLEQRYIDAAQTVLQYYLTNYREQILDFHLLSHFYAYVIEGLIDMGETALAHEAMTKIELLQNKYGFVPGYKNVKWVCSTGLFQMAIIWFKLNEIEKGEKAFEYACKLQNPSGGWFGSYYTEIDNCEKPNYLFNSEISWAVKYFLDALMYYGEARMRIDSDFFIGRISRESNSFITLKNELDKVKKGNNRLKILDVGCGKGGHLRNFCEDYPENDFYAVDIIDKTLVWLEDMDVTTKIGRLTYIPYSDQYFDFVYTCEALEHAVDIPNAIKELARVTKKGGTMVVIDKYKEALDKYCIERWEQFFDEEELKKEMQKYCSTVNLAHGIGHSDSMCTMSAWIGIVK